MAKWRVTIEVWVDGPDDWDESRAEQEAFDTVRRMNNTDGNDQINATVVKEEDG